MRSLKLLASILRKLCPGQKSKVKIYKGQITPKIVGIELWFLYTALLHNVTYLYMKFKVTSFNTFEVMLRQDFMTHRQTDRQGDSSILRQTSFMGV